MKLTITLIMMTIMFIMTYYHTRHTLYMSFCGPPGKNGERQERGHWMSNTDSDYPWRNIDGTIGTLNHRWASQRDGRSPSGFWVPKQNEILRLLCLGMQSYPHSCLFRPPNTNTMTQNCLLRALSTNANT